MEKLRTEVFTVKEELSCDILVAGSGLAGIRAAFDASKSDRKILWLTDGQLCSGSSFYPLTSGLGSQVADSKEDEEALLKEVLETGRAMADPLLTEAVIRETAVQMERLPEIGIHPILQKSDRPACFAKRERLLYDWGNWEKIRGSVRKIFAAIPNVTIREHSELTRLDVKDRKIRGALFINERDELAYVRCGAVILATGGYCGLYKHSLNTKETTGVGHSLALDAGAGLVNLEFIQFIPGFTKPVYKLLFSETTLRRAVSVKNTDGGKALENYLATHPEAHGVTVKECLEDRAMHGPFTTEDRSRYFEQAMMEDACANHRECGFEIRFEEKIAGDPNGFIRMAREMYAPYGIDLAKDPVWLAPFAHCCNGGIRIGLHGETSVAGLFAAGETAGGVHGADRHGGMATAAALVFGSRAAQGVNAYLNETASDGSEDPAGIQKAEEMFADWVAPKENRHSEAVSAKQILKDLAENLWYTANCCRDGKELSQLLLMIREIKEVYDVKMAARNEGLKNAMCAFHGLRTAEALVLAMLERKESRGPHYRRDCPEKKKELDGRRVLVEETAGKILAYTESGQ